MRVIIIHGTYGNPEANWFPWLADQVKLFGHTALRPRMPTPEGQSQASWVDAFANQVGPLKSDMILVGHSMGPALAFRLLEASKTPITATFAVSGFLGALNLPDFDPLIASFFEQRFDWKTIQRNAGASFVYHGDDDPYVPVRYSSEIAHQLGTELTLIQGGGHLNQESDYTKFEQLWQDLRPLLAA